MKPASRVMRGVSYFGAGFVSALVVVFCWSVRSPSSRLTSDLPADYKLASAKFDARVRGRFPIGTPIYVLSDELEKQGFRPAWSDDQGGYDEHIAERVNNDFGCSYSSRVHWRLNVRGTVSSIRGLRRETCL